MFDEGHHPIAIHGPRSISINVLKQTKHIWWHEGQFMDVNDLHVTACLCSKDLGFEKKWFPNGDIPAELLSSKYMYWNKDLCALSGDLTQQQQKVFKFDNSDSHES